LEVEKVKRPVSLVLVEEDLAAVYEEVVGTSYSRRKIESAMLLATSLNNRGVSMIDLGHEYKALAAFSEALKFDPSYPEAVYNQVMLLWKRGEITDTDAVDRVLAVSINLPRSWRPFHLLGLVHISRRAAEEAEATLENALKIAPLEPEPRAAIDRIKTEKSSWPKCIRTLQSPGMTSLTFVFSADGRYALSMSSHSVRLLDLKTGKFEFKLVGHRRVESAAFSFDGKFALTGSRDGTVRLWDLEKGSLVIAIEGHKDEVSACCFSPMDSTQLRQVMTELRGFGN
jgi:WD40 repeat protein